MQINELRENRLRELARIHPGDARVLSVFLNLDPTEFAAPPARATEIASVIDDAHRRVRHSDGLSHEAKKGLEEDLDRAAAFLRDLSPKGAHGFALFACGAADLFEGIRLPQPIETRAVIEDTPFVEPLVEMAVTGDWMVVLANRQTGRMLRGDRHGLHELAVIVAEAVFLRFRRRSFDHLLLGGPAEVLADFEEKLHPYLRERLRGRIDVDVENTSPDDVRAAAAPKIEEFDRARESEALERIREGVSKGARAAAGLDGVLEALNERRVETLVVGH